MPVWNINAIRKIKNKIDWNSKWLIYEWKVKWKGIEMMMKSMEN